MKRITIWIFCIVFIVIFFRQYSEYQHVPKALILATTCAILVCIAVVAIWLICRLIRKIYLSVQVKIKCTSNNIIERTSNIISEGTMYTIDSSYYAIAEEEVNNKNIDDGLWAKALVNAKGNEEVRKSEYIKLRVKQLQKGN